MQVRQRPGDGGAPILSATMAASYVPVFSYWDGRRFAQSDATLIQASISEIDLEAIPLAADPARPVELVYDVHVTPAGELKRVLTGGKFTVYPGVTI